MAEIKELLDLHSDYWGNKFISANDRLRNTEKLLDYVTHLAFPRFESEIWTPARTYKPFTFVHDSEGTSYVSLAEVPSGVDITNVAYWRKWDVRDSSIQSIITHINKMKDDIKFIETIASGGLLFRGTCKYDELPNKGNNVNDTFYCTDKGCRYTWNGKEWSQSSMNEDGFQEGLNGLEERVIDLEERVGNHDTELDNIKTVILRINSSLTSILETTTF